MIPHLLPILPGLLALFLSCLATTGAQAAHVVCAQGEVMVADSTAEDTHDVCHAARQVFSSFRQLGLYATASFVVSTVANKPEEMGPEMLGCFLPESRSVRILSFEAARRRGLWFGRPIDRALYRSLAAHEIAHALAWCNTSSAPLSVRAREYVAYAVMFQTMDAGLREAILAGTPGTGFESEREISETYYYLAPSRFGVDAYRHFLRPENGPGFLREILHGSALPVLED